MSWISKGLSAVGGIAGGAIGTLVAPGVGTAVGAAVGSSLGSAAGSQVQKVVTPDRQAGQTSLSQRVYDQQARKTTTPTQVFQVASDPNSNSNSGKGLSLHLQINVS